MASSKQRCWFFVILSLSCLKTIDCYLALSYKRLPRRTMVTKSSTPDILGSSSLVLSKRHHFKEGKIRLILASQSPRRREILDMMGLAGQYEVLVSPLDEEAAQETMSKADPAAYTQTLAEHKADALVETLMTQASIGAVIVLAADTIVAQTADDGLNSVLEKPKSKQQAIEMLTRLQDNEHFVHTGVAIRVVNERSMVHSVSFVDTATVKFAPLTSTDIAAYVETGEPMDKAGSYGIQGIGGQFVERIQGDFFTVSRAGKYVNSSHMTAMLLGYGSPDAQNKQSTGSYDRSRYPRKLKSNPSRNSIDSQRDEESTLSTQLVL